MIPYIGNAENKQLRSDSRLVAFKGLWEEEMENDG